MKSFIISLDKSNKTIHTAKWQTNVNATESIINIIGSRNEEWILFVCYSRLPFGLNWIWWWSRYIALWLFVPSIINYRTPTHYYDIRDFSSSSLSWSNAVSEWLEFCDFFVAKSDLIRILTVLLRQSKVEFNVEKIRNHKKLYIWSHFKLKKQKEMNIISLRLE